MSIDPVFLYWWAGLTIIAAILIKLLSGFAAGMASTAYHDNHTSWPKVIIIGCVIALLFTLVGYGGFAAVKKTVAEAVIGTTRVIAVAAS